MNEFIYVVKIKQEGIQITGKSCSGSRGCCCCVMHSGCTAAAVLRTFSFLSLICIHYTWTFFAVFHFSISFSLPLSFCISCRSWKEVYEFYVWNVLFLYTERLRILQKTFPPQCFHTIAVFCKNPRMRCEWRRLRTRRFHQKCEERLPGSIPCWHAYKASFLTVTYCHCYCLPVFCIM